MTFTYTYNNEGIPEHLGRLKLVSGQFANTTSAGSSNTGGTIETGLTRVYHFDASVTSTAGATANAAVGVHSNGETFPTTTGDIAIVTDEDADGTWYAIGE